METREKLIEIMGQYTTDNYDISANALEHTLKKILSSHHDFSDREVGVQRDYSVNFQWGHNHDFGAFKMDGVLGDRHIDLIETFVDDFGLPINLAGKQVLDVGIWCGGTSLLLAGMGARVIGIEEVGAYSHCAHLLFKTFDLDANIYGADTLYEHDFIEKYDYIIFPGILYHLSDPLVALRILFNALKDGGELYIETMICDVDIRPMFQFYSGRGNNWMVPTTGAVQHLCSATGFEWIGHYKEDGDRYICKVIRHKWKPMLRSGLSRRVR